MIYGAWDITAGKVTTSDGSEVTAVWATRAPSSAEWSSTAPTVARIYAINEAALSNSDFPAPTKDDFGRVLMETDPEAVAAIACLK
jgi:hypothetical protein